MSISKQYNRIIRKELRVHAAWFPIVNVYTIGDYGIIENGLFVRRGNIKKILEFLWMSWTVLMPASILNPPALPSSSWTEESRYKPYLPLLLLRKSKYSFPGPNPFS
ncbi:MAG: hypothetical protein IPK94_07610 [Saprospiraceae bacterium]|nr:hypothetical protein [Saprospiraceae bacterium]